MQKVYFWSSDIYDFIGEVICGLIWKNFISVQESDFEDLLSRNFAMEDIGWVVEEKEYYGYGFRVGRWGMEKIQRRKQKNILIIQKSGSEQLGFGISIFEEFRFIK